MTIANLNVATSSQALSNNGAPANPEFWGKDGFTFKSFTDIINPLQQLPVVSTLYRALTGDTISSGSRLAGGALLGGPLGFASALFNEIIKGQTGNDIGGNMVAMVEGHAPNQFAQNESGSSAPSPTNQAAYKAYMHTQSMLA
jgi:hypothetical protein